MPKPAILPRSVLQAALLLTPSLTGCAQGRPRLVLPPIERAEAVTAPVVPTGKASCGGLPCLSDAETAQLIADYDAALTEANRRLGWLHDWIKTAAN